jgi:hypothetical protein
MPLRVESEKDNSMTTPLRYGIEGIRCDDGFFEWLVIDTLSLVTIEEEIARCRNESDARLIANALNAFIKPRFISQAPMAKAIR